MKEIELFQKKYPLHEHTVKGVIVPYRYVKKENAEVTLVLLTGGLGFSDLFFTHFEEFSKQYPVLTFDYPEQFQTNQELADAIAELIIWLGIKQVFLVAQSYGGFLAQVFAKSHPALIYGMSLSNTGSLSVKMGEAGKNSLTEMLKQMKKMIKLLHFIPIGILKPAMRKKLLKKLDGADPEEYKFMSALFMYAVDILTASHERHMCGLMADLEKHWNMTQKDFAALDGRILLILSEDDDTFHTETKQSLAELMGTPVVRTDISGGHLALFLKIDAYIDAVEKFISGLDK